MRDRRAHYRSAEYMASERLRVQSRDEVELALYGCKARAKQQGLAFSVERKDLPNPDRCPLCEAVFQRRTMRARSIDRIHNHVGYIKGNVAVICRRCNMLKGNASLEFVRRLLSYMEASNG